MKTMTATIARTAMIVLFLLSVSLTPYQPLAAQEPDGPPPKPYPERGVISDERGDYAREGADQVAASSFPLGVGGPDVFGYWWDDSTALNWIDATNGTDTGMKGESYQQKVGPIALPFAFKFYENTYSELYIAAPGYVGFTDSGNWDHQPNTPSPNTPNNIIVPYGSLFELANSGKNNRVFYKSGGTAPNRYFVVEWYKVVGSELNGRQDDEYTFEVILYENGDIQFQYLSMTNKGGYWCGRIGIEDAEGLDGLRYSNDCSGAQSNSAIRFTRPAPAARMRVTPSTQGRMTTKATTEIFAFTVKNIGELGSDIFNLSVLSPWPTRLRTPVGATLTDSNGDGQPDLGLLAVGQSATALLEVQTPAFMHLGDHASVMVSARSSIDGTRQKNTTIHLGVAAPFYQVFLDWADRSANALALQPFKMTWRLLNTPDANAPSDAAIAALSNGDSFHAWNHYTKASQGNWNQDIHFVQTDADLAPRYGVRQLTGNDTFYYSYNSSIAAAVAPDGSAGLLWQRELWDRNSDKYVWNMYFAIVNGIGDVVLGPVSLTNHTTLVDWRWDIEHFYDPRITATQDNRFVLAWNTYVESSDDWFDNIDYAIYSSAGAQVKPVTRYSTEQARSKDNAGQPTLTTLSNGQVFLGYVNTDDGSIANVLLNSNGDVTRGPLHFIPEAYGFGFDSYQFPDGRVIAVWTDWSDEKPVVSYAIFSSNGATLTAGPTLVNNSPSITGDFYPSVTGDPDGHAVITWRERHSNHWRNLYYMAVDSNGSVVTPPMPFLAANPNTATPRIWSSRDGYGNAPNTAVKPRSTVMPALFISAPAVVVGQQSGVAGFSMEVGNEGTPLAAGVTLQAQLPPELAYFGSSLPPSSVVPPAGNGGKVTWSLPSLDYLSSGVVTLYTTVPSTTVGASYPITLTINTTAPESDQSRTTGHVEVVEGAPVFLPVVMR